MLNNLIYFFFLCVKVKFLILEKKSCISVAEALVYGNLRDKQIADVGL